MKTPKFWNPETFEISSYRFRINERINNSYTTSGSDNTGICTYTYNEFGFRADSINKQGFKIMAIGDSFTEGVGVNDWETWPHYFTQHIPNGVNLNFGMGGRSNDYIVRCLMTYYDLIKPDLVLIMYTQPHRKEIYTKDGNIEPFVPTVSWGWLLDTKEGCEIQNNLVSLQNDNSDLINWYKNHSLIKYFLESKNCNWLWNGNFGISIEYDEFNRFDGKYDQHLDKAVDNWHAGPLHNYKYGIKLFEHIKTNFENYIPYESNVNRNLL
jgi:hypothetical protein